MQIDPEGIRKESEMYGDMVIVEGEEDYKKLLMRTMRFLEWIREGNFTYTWLLKTDDDSFVRVNGLLSYLHELNIHTRLHMGRFSHTWTSGSCFFGSIEWGYPAGAGWLMTSDVVTYLTNTPFPLELDPYTFDTRTRRPEDDWLRTERLMDAFGRPEDTALGLALAGFKLNRVSDKRFHDYGWDNYWERFRFGYPQPNTTRSLLIHHVTPEIMGGLAEAYRVLDTQGCEGVWRGELGIVEGGEDEVPSVSRINGGSEV
ncbi:UDP-Gal betaGal beta 1,3-galactosyltransferase, polypeptide 6 [Quaeritorhiza haematococci]|nr:UDP-Gal betaGal beta 1,3-galactosyltransferase, polypeptide 6 [Quaeritorhiza haematococci]